MGLVVKELVDVAGRVGVELKAMEPETETIQTIIKAMRQSLDLIETPIHVDGELLFNQLDMANTLVNLAHCLKTCAGIKNEAATQHANMAPACNFSHLGV